ncbi:MAG: oxaloacetate decarboxylase subunit gamma [Syntrophomonadaceae bacterium]|jgi:Na+-transporting methylmalonyl-CoA/oxaloacetate decarboxylase gamma subunit
METIIMDALVIFATGILGVFLVMSLLLLAVSLSSKLAIWIENRGKENVPSSNG